MKLDKLKFAEVIAYISTIMSHQTIDSNDVRILDELIDIDVLETKVIRVGQYEMDQFLEALYADRKIEAIKLYRAITLAPLKEAKDAIEKWPLTKKIVNN